MEEAEYLDYVLVPTGLVVLGLYHLWLFYTIIRHPTTTVVGVNSLSRQQWVLHMMAVSFFSFLLLFILYITNQTIQEFKNKMQDQLVILVIRK